MAAFSDSTTSNNTTCILFLLLPPSILLNSQNHACSNKGLITSSLCPQDFSPTLKFNCAPENTNTSTSTQHHKLQVNKLKVAFANPLVQQEHMSTVQLVTTRFPVFVCQLPKETCLPDIEITDALLPEVENISHDWSVFTSKIDTMVNKITAILDQKFRECSDVPLYTATKTTDNTNKFTDYLIQETKKTPASDLQSDNTKVLLDIEITDTLLPEVENISHDWSLFISKIVTKINTITTILDQTFRECLVVPMYTVRKTTDNTNNLTDYLIQETKSLLHLIYNQITQKFCSTLTSLTHCLLK